MKNQRIRIGDQVIVPTATQEDSMNQQRKRDVLINVTDDGRLAVGIFWTPTGARISGTYFQAWPAVLNLIARMEREGLFPQVFVRSDVAVNTPDGLVF